MRITKRRACPEEQRDERVRWGLSGWLQALIRLKRPDSKKRQTRKLKPSLNGANDASTYNSLNPSQHPPAGAQPLSGRRHFGRGLLLPKTSNS